MWRRDTRRLEGNAFLVHLTFIRTNDPEGSARAVAVALGTDVKFVSDGILIGG